MYTMPRFVCYFVDREDHIDDVVYLDARSLALAVYRGSRFWPRIPIIRSRFGLARKLFFGATAK